MALTGAGSVTAHPCRPARPSGAVMPCGGHRGNGCHSSSYSVCSCGVTLQPHRNHQRVETRGFCDNFASMHFRLESAGAHKHMLHHRASPALTNRDLLSRWRRTKTNAANHTTKPSYEKNPTHACPRGRHHFLRAERDGGAHLQRVSWLFPIRGFF